MPDEPTLRDRLEVEVPRATCDDLPESTLDAVMDVVAPELEQRDERVAELEIDLSNQIKVGLACGKVHARVRAERDEARAEVERLRSQHSCDMCRDPKLVTPTDDRGGQVCAGCAVLMAQAEVERLRAALEYADEFIERVTAWSGGTKEDCDVALHEIRAALAAASGNTETGTCEHEEVVPDGVVRRCRDCNQVMTGSPVTRWTSGNTETGTGRGS